MEALRQFLFDCKWTGTVEEGGMGPNSPRMTAKGQGTIRPIMGGLWLVGDFEQEQFVHGERLIRWQAHYIAGWNGPANEYRIALVEYNGITALMSGRIEGNSFITENSAGSPLRLQMVWERLAEGKIKWTNRSSINDGPWFLIEEYVCSPL
jgi:hypothetical protein